MLCLFKQEQFIHHYYCILSTGNGGGKRRSDRAGLSRQDHSRSISNSSLDYQVCVDACLLTFFICTLRLPEPRIVAAFCCRAYYFYINRDILFTNAFNSLTHLLHSRTLLQEEVIPEQEEEEAGGVANQHE